MASERDRPFYGWTILPLAFAVYGLGISPAYYGWGFFLPELLAELGLSRQQGGQMFGLFTFLMTATGPLVGLLLYRFGVRATMTAGACVAAVGFALLSRAESALGCYLAFSVLGAVGISLLTIVPCQTLATNWFKRGRATALGVVLAAGGLVGMLVPHYGRVVLRVGDWRLGWLLIAALAAGLAAVAALYVRDRPEDLGQLPYGDDGAAAGPAPRGTPSVADATAAAAGRAALRTGSFAAVVAIAVGATVPWVVVVTHGRLHFTDLGLADGRAAGLLATMVLASVPGRLLAGLGDLFAPQTVVALALAAEAIGVAGLLWAGDGAVASVAVVLIGLGFGTAYAGVSVLLARLFGRAAFPMLSGARLFITALFNLAAPALAGAVADRTGSYRPAFLALVLLALFTAAIAATLRRRPTAAAESAAQADIRP